MKLIDIVNNTYDPQEWVIFNEPFSSILIHVSPKSVTLPLKMECEATKNNAPFWSVD